MKCHNSQTNENIHHFAQLTFFFVHGEKFKISSLSKIQVYKIVLTTASRTYSFCISEWGNGLVLSWPSPGLEGERASWRRLRCPHGRLWSFLELWG